MYFDDSATCPSADTKFMGSAKLSRCIQFRDCGTPHSCTVLMMTSLFRTMREQFPAALRGIEMGQVIFRLATACLFGVYLVFLHLSGARQVGVGLALLVAVYASFALAWTAVVHFGMLRLRTRFSTSIVLDQGLFALAFFFGGDLLAPVLWAPTSVSLGYGLLGGSFYARFAALLGAALMALAFAWSPDWSEVPLLSTGIVLATLIVPWHGSMLAEQIGRSKKEIQRRALAFEIASKTDSLTGALNRAGFEKELDAVLQRTARTGEMSGVMMLDLDGFKEVNDSAGHAIGDAVLKEVVRCLQKGLRASDRIGRLGGDEFGILVLHLINEEDAEWLAYKVLRAIEDIRIPEHPDMRITGSIGIQVLPDPACDTVDAIVAAADRLMYAAKDAGKNQYRSSTESGLWTPQSKTSHL